MKKIKELFACRIFKVFVWVILVLVGLFIVFIIIRTFNYFDVQKTNNQVNIIHGTKLSLDSVMGANLPPLPGLEADKTIQGIDANDNGIRDDVELAIFTEYPNSAKTRAVLLQYALVLQMETTQTFLNEEIVTEIVTEEGRADTCLSDTLVPRKSTESSRTDLEMNKIENLIIFIENKQFDTEERKNARNIFYKYLGSYGESKNITCDIDYSKLPN